METAFDPVENKAIGRNYEALAQGAILDGQARASTSKGPKSKRRVSTLSCATLRGDAAGRIGWTFCVGVTFPCMPAGRGTSIAASMENHTL